MNQIKTFKKYALALMMVGIMLATGFQTSTAAVDSNVRMIPESFSQLAEEVRPGVVNIRTEKSMKDGGPVFRHFFGNPFGDPNPHAKIPGPFSQPNPNRKSVSTLEDYYRKLEDAGSDKPIQFLIKRPNVGYLAIKIV